jgi:hypothetical protein
MLIRFTVTLERQLLIQTLLELLAHAVWTVLTIQ